MRQFYRLTGAAAIFLFGLLSVGSSHAAAPELQVGIAAVDVTPEIGVPLGGFGGGERRILPFDLTGRCRWCTFLKPSTGVHDPIRSKAMVLSRDARRLLFISLDVVAVTAKFRNDLMGAIEPLGFRDDEVFISGTHTHSGPGTLSHEWLWEIAAMDRFQPEIYARFKAGVVESVRQAIASLEPSELYSVTFDAQGIQRNRRGHPGRFDPQANALLVLGSKGQWLGGMINLAVHGTSLGTDNHLFSADAPGGLEHATEILLSQLNGPAPSAPGARPTVLFVNGAEGDVAPSETLSAGIDRLGDRFSGQLSSAMRLARRIEPEWRIHRDQVDLGKPGLTLISCVSRNKRKYVNKRVRIGLGSALPEIAAVSVLELGDLKLMTWPGEPTTELGLELKRRARESGAREAWVMGLTNGYMAYFTSPEEWKEGGYEACSSVYGQHAGEKLVESIGRLLPAPLH